MTRLTQRRFARQSPGPTCGSCPPRILLSSRAACCSTERAICSSVSRPPVINAIRGHLAEFGIVAPVGRHGVEEPLHVEEADPSDRRVPEMARACLLAFGAQLRRIKAQIFEFDRLISAWHRSNETSMRLDEAPGIGPVLATALVATVADPKTFRFGRNFSAWIGMVPKHFERGQEQARQDQQARGPLSAWPVRGRGARRHPLRRDPWHQTSALAHGLAGAAADEGCCYRARQQDRANGLGHDGQRRAIQGARRACDVNGSRRTTGVM